MSNSVSGDVSGDVVQVGAVHGNVHIAEVNLVTGLPVRTSYRHQVQRIAPPALIGREAELAELAEFCTSPSTPSDYQWWRAQAWSGKSALLSWFVLHPPDGVRVVSFFVTGRLSSQNDRTAFIDNLLEQLQAVLGESLPPSLSESTKEGHLLGLLTDAAEACRSRGERFVLLVDGLDEDRGVHVGPEAHSIAALLPARPPAGMRVVVAGRPNPPIPTDVPGDHPLRDGAIIRPLAPSPHARAIREEMERELKRLLQGTRLERDLLGLVATAGGGLTAADLSELTGESRYQVDDQLRTVTGRTFARRDTQYRTTAAPDIYLLGHEELQVAALEMLKPASLNKYREQLHAWAEKYRAQRWPPTTPEYLLHGYSRMLQALPDPTRLVELATDGARHDRLLELTGGDAAALVEVDAALDIVYRHDAQNLLAMTRVTMARDELAFRNSRLPAKLPAVWATLGQPIRAESLARGIADQNTRASALALLTTTLASTGDHDRAESIARTIGTPTWQSHALIELATSTARAGDRGRAAALAFAAESAIQQLPIVNGLVGRTARLACVRAMLGQHSEAAALLDTAMTDAARLEDTDMHAAAQTAIAIAVAAIGDHSRATQIVDAIPEASDRVQAFAALASDALIRGEHDRAASLIDRAESTVHAVVDPSDRVAGLVAVARQTAATGDRARTAALVDAILAVAWTFEDADQQEWALVEAVEVAAANGDLDQAADIADEMVGWPLYDYALQNLARMLGTAGNRSLAETIAGDISKTRVRAEALAELAEAAATDGDLADAIRFARLAEVTARGDSDDRRARLLSSVAKALATTGQCDLAESIAGHIMLPDKRIETLTSLASAAASAGETQRALDLVSAAEVLSQDISNPWAQEVARTALVTAWAAAGDFDRAAETAEALAEPLLRTRALARLARALVGHDQARALAAADRAQSAADNITESLPRDQALVVVVAAVAATGDTARAMAIADNITDPIVHDRATLEVAAAMGAAGEFDAAFTVVETIDNDYVHDDASAKLAKALVSADDLEAAEEIAGALADAGCRAEVETALATAAASAGDWERAESSLRSLPREYQNLKLLTKLARVAAEANDSARARRFVMDALLIGRKTIPLRTLGTVEPAALTWIAQHLIDQGH